MQPRIPLPQTGYDVYDVTGGRLPYPDPYGLNANDEVAGDFTGDGSAYGGFVARQPGQVHVVAPPHATSSFLFAINGDGTSVGVWKDEAGNRHAFVCDQNNAITDLSAILGWPNSAATDINDAGVVVGWVGDSLDWNTARYRSFVYDPNAAEPVQTLGAFAPFTNSSASGINNAGQVVGTCFSPDGASYRPYLYEPGGDMVKFTDETANGIDINDQGHILCVHQDFLYTGGNSGPFIWNNGTITDIPVNGIPRAINNHDQVVGDAMGAHAGTDFGFLYDSGTVIDVNTLLPWFYQVRVALAYDINDRGDITAAGFDKDYNGYALLLVRHHPRKGLHMRPVLSLVMQILYGVTNDGGGLGFIDNQPVPVGPWGELSQSQIDLVFERASSIIERQFRDDEESLREAREALEEARREWETRGQK